MSNIRSTADYLDSILLLAGETTNGNSAYEARALYFLNQMHTSIIAGGSEFNVEVDEMWPWALNPIPLHIELQPAYETGTLNLTEGSTSGTFSLAPSISLKGYHFSVTGESEVYRIVSHTASQTGFTFDSPYAQSTNATASYRAIKLDYELVTDVMEINEDNNKISFTEATAGTELTATLTVGVYTPSALATEVKTALDAAGASTYTVTYSALTRKFTLTSDLSGANNLFSLLGASGSEALVYTSALPTLGLGLKDHTGAASYSSERSLTSITKLSEPMKLHTGYDDYSDVGGVDKLRFAKDYPLSTTTMGNPTRFCVIEERSDGYIKVRFNRYVESARRVEVNYIPTPLKLYDNTKSHPLIPLKYARLLDYGGAAYLMAEKNDNRASQYFQLAGQLLQAMMQNSRKTSERVGEYFGEIIARPDLMPSKRRRLLYGEPEG